MLGRAPVVDGQHLDVAGVGDAATGAVMGVQVAYDEGAAVGEEHQRPCSLGGPVVAQPQPVRPMQVFHVGQRGSLGTARRSPA